jgi:hypothetical protein
MSDIVPIKVAVSVSEMAQMVGLSRARFYQLLSAGVFPPPLRDPTKKRPYFDQKLQERCLEVRRRNCGINGEPVLFYARRQIIALNTPKAKKTTKKKAEGEYDDLLDSLKALGLVTVTVAQVGDSLNELYPKGTEGVAEAQLIRAVFLHLKRQNRDESVGR